MMTWVTLAGRRKQIRSVRELIVTVKFPGNKLSVKKKSATMKFESSINVFVVYIVTLYTLYNI